MNKNQTPSWDLDTEYTSLTSATFKADLDLVMQYIIELEKQESKMDATTKNAASLNKHDSLATITDLQNFALIYESAQIRLNNLKTFINCLLASNANDTAAAEMRSFLDALSARFAAASAPLFIIITLVSDEVFEYFCSSNDTARMRFIFSQERKSKARLLALPAEKAIAAMSADGFHAWAGLYDSLTGTIQCKIKKDDGTELNIGLAQASGLLKQPDRGLREAAWRGINEAFSQNKHSFAAIINAIAGWRGTENSLRSHTEPVHYIDQALKQNRICRATLDTLIKVLSQSKELGRKALRLQASLYNVSKLGPWDILAPAPAIAKDKETSVTTFKEAIDIVSRAYSYIDPSMGEFVKRMAALGRIEAQVKTGKRPGAFCTTYPVSRNPYVYMTYQGSLSDISTLAHELGHAYHNDVLKNIPVLEAKYPMTLAETASTFAETVLADVLMQEAKDENELLKLAWADAHDASGFLINIPARFTFESKFYEARPSGFVGPEKLGQLMRSAWEEWYGDALSDYDNWFWASKLHFHKTTISFYNFPYSFGYLFSLGVYAQRKILGDGFHEAYKNLLRDTGRMEVEELAYKHLAVDITKPDFWNESVGILAVKVANFEKLVSKALKK